MMYKDNIFNPKLKLYKLAERKIGGMYQKHLRRVDPSPIAAIIRSSINIDSPFVLSLLKEPSRTLTDYLVKLLPTIF